MLSLKEMHQRLLLVVDAHDALNEPLQYKLRLTRRTALYLLARRFRKHLLELTKLQTLDNPSLVELPPLKTNRVAMARYMGVSERSVYNYLAFYERMGIIKKTFHGRQRDFDVVLHPWFFADTTAMPRPFVFGKSSTTPPAFCGKVSTFLPPIIARDTRENNNCYNEAVENVDKPQWQVNSTTPPRFPDSHSNTRIEHEKAVSCQNPTGKAQEKEGAGPQKLSTLLELPELKKLVGAENVDKSRQKEKPSSSHADDRQSGRGLNTPDLDLEGYALSLVRQFWGIAKAELYADCVYSDKQHTQIEGEILNSVFRNFQGAAHSKNAIFQRYLFYVDCLRRAKRYAEKLHWISFLPAEKYFSETFYRNQLQNKEKGSFFYVVEWAKTDLKRQTEAKKQAWLNNAKRNIALGKSPKGIRLTSRIEIIAHYLNLVHKYGPTYVEQLNEFISNPTNFKTT